MHIQVGYFGMVMRSCVKSAKVSITIAVIIITLALVFGFEFLFGRADIGALVTAIVLGTSALVCLSGRAGKFLPWVREKIFDSIWRIARYF